jgi:hypothetical protein
MTKENLIAKCEKYQDNAVIHVFIKDSKVCANYYDSIGDMLASAKKITYKKGLNTFTVTLSTLNASIELGDAKDFIIKARTYGKRYKVRCYKAFYTEVYIAKLLNGKHNNRYTPHGKGDIVVDGIPYEVKFGSEIIL